MIEDGMGALSFARDAKEQEWGQDQNSSKESARSDKSGPFLYNEKDHAAGTGFTPGGDRGRPASRIRSRTSPGSVNASNNNNESVGSQDSELDCTFQPQVKALPRMYGQSGVLSASFHERNAKWHGMKQKRQDRLKKELSRRETDGCTFNPKVNESSSSANDGSNDANNSRQRLTAQHRSVRSTIGQQQYKKSKEEEFEQTCTFQPKLAPGSIKLLNQGGSRVAKKGNYTGLEECTFAPKTNNIPVGMDAAQLYLEQDPFLRLSSKVASTATPDEQGAQPYGVDNGNKGTLPKSPEEAKAINEAFLQRQDQWVAHMASRKQQLRAEYDDEIGLPKSRGHSRNPSRGNINSSNNSNDNNNSGDSEYLREFMLRTQIALERKARNQADNVKEDPECTFKPKINNYSKQKASRTVEEMSVGDYARQQAKMDIARAKKDREEMEGATFRPKIRSKDAKSVLQISSDPDSYMRRMELKEFKVEQRRERIKEELLFEETRHCTFQPETRDTPSYIRDFAEISRQARAQESEQRGPEVQVRPEWR